jgi:phage terminase large subunit
VEWPPNFSAELDRRLKLEHRLTAEPDLLAGALLQYAQSPADFISDCVYLYEPRHANVGDPVQLPCVLFDRQRQFIAWLHERFTTRTSAPVEKSRDSGATWMSCAFAVWVWLFHPGSTVGFGSRKEILVDRAGDLQSIFEKIRSIVRNLPHYLKPRGFKEHTHSNYMRLLNPANSATIIGEAGDNIGRGGRTSLFFVDESAHIERPALIEASLSATTDCRIDISSPLVGTLFNEWAAKSQSKFIFDVRDAPWHTEEWVKAKRADLEGKGLSYIFAQEFLRDGTAGIEGQLIPGDWVEAAVNGSARYAIKPTGERVAALDVADGGKDRSALTVRYGVEVLLCKSRGDLLADGAGAWAYAIASQNGCQRLLYDNIGVGAGAAAALRDKKDIKVTGWNAAGAVVNRTQKYQGTRPNEDMFANAKAQAWWALRDRFLEAFKASKGEAHDADAIISLSPAIEELRELKSELSQVTFTYNPAGKIIVNKAPDGHSSPNRADSVMIAFAPVKRSGVQLIGIFGTDGSVYEPDAKIWG